MLRRSLLALTCFIFATPRPVYASFPKFDQLQQLLEQKGFEVRLEIPPGRGQYGALNLETRQIWINPVVFDLEIAIPTLVHEAVHAAQLCAGGDRLSLVALDVQPPAQARPFFTRYHGYGQSIEFQAYAVQTQRDRVELATDLLQQYCPDRSSN
jgi:hypothetical protein